MEVKSTDNGQPRVPGELDRSFAIDGRIEISERGTANAITSDKDGNLFLVSQISDRFRLSRYFLDGAKDEQFEETTWNFEDGDQSRPTRVLLQDGKILVIGESLKDGALRPAVARFNASGSPDLVFGRRVISTGPEEAILNPFSYKFVDGCLQKDQKVLVSADYTLQLGRPLARLFRLQASGEPDDSFGGGRGFIDVRFHDRDSYANNVHIQNNGAIIVAGSWRNDGEQHRTRTVARYTVDGVLDNSFGQAGYADIVVPDDNLEKSQMAGLPVHDIVSRVVVQENDRIVVAGYAGGLDGVGNGLLARLEHDGTFDQTFNQGKPLLISRPLNDLAFQSLAIQPDGKIVAVGRGIMAGTTMELYVRVGKDGESEEFWRGNSVGDCSDVTIQPQGRVVISGSSGTTMGGIRYPRVWGRLGS